MADLNNGAESLTPNPVSNVDAMAWVNRWMEVVAANPNVPQDPGVMLSWFANAIETGRDHERNKPRDITDTEIARAARALVRLRYGEGSWEDATPSIQEVYKHMSRDILAAANEEDQ